jgi:A/G-specific adenine glycosylase
MSSDFEEFVRVVWAHYAEKGRELPWRRPEPDGSFDSYKIMVSEIMLQQTQVSRFVDKYQEFIKLFPTITMLAGTPSAEIIRSWQGLGYNRRAKNLHDTARMVLTVYRGRLPRTKEQLISLPGIGLNTAGAILVYAHNQPEIFIETNIRTVFIHHFFRDKTNVTDKQILALVQQSLPKDNARQWYWALMDYGSYLKKIHGNPNKASKHYVRQSRFEGSLRQIRGEVIRELSRGKQNPAQLQQSVVDMRLPDVLEALVNEGLIHRSRGYYTLGRANQ